MTVPSTEVLFYLHCACCYTATGIAWHFFSAIYRLPAPSSNNLSCPRSDAAAPVLAKNDCNLNQVADNFQTSCWGCLRQFLKKVSWFFSEIIWNLQAGSLSEVGMFPQLFGRSVAEALEQNDFISILGDSNMKEFISALEVSCTNMYKLISCAVPTPLAFHNRRCEKLVSCNRFCLSRCLKKSRSLSW